MDLVTVAQIRGAMPAFVLILLSCLSRPCSSLGASGTDPAEEASLPQQGFFTSLKQATNEDFDREVVRGHFDLGTPPNVHRYYCMVDPKTGRKQPNGVLGKPYAAAGGLTRIRDTAVSLYRCSDAEQQGLLMTTGYVTGISAAGTDGQSPPSAPPPAQPQLPASPSTQTQTAAVPPPDASSVEVDGVRLGMSPDEVRAALRAKNLSDYYESAGALRRSAGRFVNIIASWALGEDGESYEVMFTPVPGRERAMAIVHSRVYSAANAVREASFQNGLMQKYGGYDTPRDVPESPTWRFQSGGKVQVGDACNRHGVFGVLSDLNVAAAPRKNVALETSPEEFRYQLERCGTAIVTEDHAAIFSGPSAATSGGAAREERMITRFTVTAYSPLIASEGAAAAAQLIPPTSGPIESRR
jgi:hypothetical protein